ncbi:MAG TPA: exonuclease subunit SbcD [Mycobacteriales bacterium]|nr:exonuclease subunit SbcD [Mycobacteriales bacterium]
MRFLHTSDWHVGKTLKGHDRLPEQREVLAEIVRIAAVEQVDAVLVAGDLYETATPGAEAQQLVIRTLLALRDTGAQVIAIAGNHDHAPTLDAYRPLAGAAGITLVGRVRRPADGGVIAFDARSDGSPVRIAALPFLSQRYAVRAAELLQHTPAENSAGYDAWVRGIIAALATGFDPAAVNVVLTHLTVTGAAMGGGERQAQSIFEYHVPAAAFPAEAHYVALGHLHRRQSVPAPCPVHYSGSPLRVDFGEVDSSPVVLLVEAAPGVPARVTDVPITSARRLRTVRGTLAELARLEVDAADLLKVVVAEPARAGLREEVQELLPGALEVHVERAEPAGHTPARPRTDRAPGELLHDYLRDRDVADPRVEALFARLHDALVAGETA